jgi:PAS domain S-box-containing protein
MLGCPWKDFLHPEDRAEVLRLFIEIIRSQRQPRDLEFRGVRKDGNVIYLASSPTRLVVNGKKVGFQAIIVNITEHKRAEKALFESQQKFERLFMGIPEAAVYWDPTFHVLDVNPSFTELFGYSLDEIRGEASTSFIVPKNRIRESNIWGRKAKEGYVDRDTVRKRKDGSLVPVSTSVAPMIIDGQLVGYVGLYKDITRRKKTEEELLYQANLLQNVSDAIIATDQNFKIKSWNKASEKIYGWKEDEVIDKKVRDVTKLEYPHDNQEEVLKQFLKEGYWRGEVTQRHKNGKTINVLASVSLIKDRAGNSIGAVAVNRDITERKKAEEALRESEAKHRNLFENARDVILTGDLEGNVTSINKAIEEYGWKREEIIGKSMLELMSKESWPSLLKGIDQIAEGKPLKGEIELATPKGKRTAEYKSNPIIQDNEVIGVQVIGRDITERKEVEQKLRDSEEKFRAITLSANDAIVLIDDEGKFSYWSPAAQKMFGYAKEEVNNKKMYELITPERFRQDHISAFERFKKIGKGNIIGKTVEVPAIKKDGTEFPVKFSLSALQVKGKWYALGIFRDVTERKKMEESLAASEEKYRSLFESANDALVYSDLTGRILNLNKRAEELAGIKKEEILGKSFWKLGLVDSKLITLLLKRLANRLKGKPDEEFELELTGKDGRKISLEVNATLIRRENIPQGFLAIVRDITEKRTLQEKLRQYSEHLEELVKKRTEELSEAEKRYSVLVEEASDGLLILQDRKIVFANKKTAEVLGYSKDELKELPSEKLVDEEYLPLAKMMYERVLQGEVSTTFEVEWRAKNGERIPMEVSDARITHQGHPAVLRVARDISDRKRMEEQRSKLEKLATIGELATMVAHDLRNPLTSIRNASFYVKNTYPYQGDTKCKTALEMLDIIEQETLFANNIINDLLDFAAKRPLQRKRRSINKIIECLLTKSDVPENIEVKKNFPERAIAAVDEKQLERVFLNLIKNAVQAMPNGGKLAVATTKTKDHVEIAFTDTGTGIAEEKKNKIFTPLFTTKAKGIGMGLAICKRIIEEHGGTIDFRSRVDQGTTFTIKLPKNKGASDQ